MNEKPGVVEGSQAGRGRVEVRVGSWADLKEPARGIRTQVFVEEQGIPLELEWDADDESAVHAVAYNQLGQPVGTGRLLQHGPGVCKIGRMAVLQPLRGSGIGRELLHALMQKARERGDREVVLHAQISAAGFYEVLGFCRNGDEFDEAGIAHVEMVRSLFPA